MKLCPSPWDPPLATTVVAGPGARWASAAGTASVVVLPPACRVGSCSGQLHRCMAGSVPVPVPRWAEVGCSVCNPVSSSTRTTSVQHLPAVLPALGLLAFSLVMFCGVSCQVLSVLVCGRGAVGLGVR